MPEEWLTSLASLVSSWHDAGRCPIMVTAASVTPANQSDYAELQTLGVSSLISATISHEGETLGVLAFCAQASRGVLSFDDLPLVQSLKGTIGLRLRERRAQRKEERFLENAFHNLKAPAHSIAGIVEKLCSDRDLDAQSGQSWLRVLNEQAQRLARLAKMTGKFTQLQKSSRARVSLHDFLRHSVQALQVAASEKDVRIVLELPFEVCEVLVDEDRLCEALECLIDNALRMSRGGQSIQVTLVVERDDYRLSVIDEGPGVPENQREAIFETFTSISRTGEPESTGLGLPYARAVIAAHGGTLRCGDVPAQRGACFSFTLPRGAESPLHHGQGA
jgi:two-component system sensor histidine kinase TctE